MSTPITSALDLAEDAILGALAALTPAGSAWWDLVPPDVARQLAPPRNSAAARARAYVAQHQDGGGRQAAHVHSLGWEGLVAIRVLAYVRDDATAGHALASAAMRALASPAGYALTARWDRPLSLPITDLIHTRAGIWRITIRRVPV